ncbi:hypothetical protein AAFM79_19620 [Trichormus azollae HNT15244]
MPKTYLVKAFTSTELKLSEIKRYSYQGEKVSYGGIEQRWLLVESADRKKADLKKLTQSIQEEFLRISKQVGRLVKEEFEQRSLAELKIKELAAKLKYHKISDLEITERLNKGQVVVCQVRGELIESQELITQYHNCCGRCI